MWYQHILNLQGRGRQFLLIGIYRIGKTCQGSTGKNVTRNHSVRGGLGRGLCGLGGAEWYAPEASAGIGGNSMKTTFVAGSRG